MKRSKQLKQWLLNHLSEQEPEINTRYDAYTAPFEGDGTWFSVKDVEEDIDDDGDYLYPVYDALKLSYLHPHLRVEIRGIPGSVALRLLKKICDKILQEAVEQYPLGDDFPPVDELVQCAYELGQDSSEDSQKRMKELREEIFMGHRFGHDIVTFIERS